MPRLFAFVEERLQAGVAGAAYKRTRAVGANMGVASVRSVMKEVNPCPPELAARHPAGPVRQSVVQVRRFGWPRGMCRAWSECPARASPSRFPGNIRACAQ